MTFLLAAVDLDGTLLASDLTVHDRTVRALRRWRAAGRGVVVVTARPPRAVRWLDAVLDGAGTALCSNGALLHDLATGRTTPGECLSAGAVGALTAALRARLPGCMLAVEHGTHMVCDVGYPPDGSPAHEMEFGDLLASSSPVAKLVVRYPVLGVEDLHAVCAEVAAGLATATYSGREFVELSAPGVDKATVLARLCAGRRIDRRSVVAFGDMPNDLPMLRWAGHGVAMANAHPRLLAVADEVTSSHDEDGVAAVLERLLAAADQERPGAGGTGWPGEMPGP